MDGTFHRILVISPRRRGTGNATTSDRLKTSLEARGCGVDVLAPEEVDVDWLREHSPEDVVNLSGYQRKYDFVFLIHALKSGQLLSSLPTSSLVLPICLIFGGTDLSIDSLDQNKREIMLKAVNKSCVCVCFTDDMKDVALQAFSSFTPKLAKNKTNEYSFALRSSPRCVVNGCVNGHKCETDANEDDHDDRKFQKIDNASQRFQKTQRRRTSLEPALEEKLAVIPQAITVCPDDSFDFLKLLNKQFGIPYSENVKIILLVACMRKVKDPLFLVDAFEEWWKKSEENSNFYYLLVGPSLDDEFTASLQDHIRHFRSVFYFPGLPIGHMHAAMRSAFAVVNSSLSEGMSAAILEAMMVQTPVLARDIKANKAIINHGETGLLFPNPPSFINCLENLIKNKRKRKYIIQNAQAYVEDNHDLALEGSKYFEIISTNVRERFQNPYS